MSIEVNFITDISNKNHQVNFKKLKEELKEKGKELNVHDDYKNLNLNELIEIQKRETIPVEVLLLNLSGDLNIGNMIRTSCVSGIKKVWIFGRRRYDRRSLVGSNNYIDIQSINGFEDNSINYNTELLKNFLEKNNFVPIYAELYKNSEILGKFSWQEKFADIEKKGKKPLIVMGNENYGFTEDVVEVFNSIEGSFCVTIPQRGVLRSFNVSNALAIILWDIRRDMKWF